MDDARDDVLAVGHLAVEGRSDPDALAGGQIDEVDHDRGRADIHGQAEDGMTLAPDHQVQQLVAAIASRQDRGDQPARGPDPMWQPAQHRQWDGQLVDAVIAA